MAVEGGSVVCVRFSCTTHSVLQQHTKRGDSASRGAAKGAEVSTSIQKLLSSSRGPARKQQQANFDSAAMRGIDADDLAARLAEQRRLGESEHVARSADIGLESDTARQHHKCDSATCLQRDGVGGVALRRCGACGQRWFCSRHCQVRVSFFINSKQGCTATAPHRRRRCQHTHTQETAWRNGHARECAQLRDAVDTKETK